MIETACGQPDGAIFEKARAKGRLAAQLHALAASVAPGPRKRRRPSVDPAGMVAVPSEMFEDVLATGGDAVAMNLDALAVFVFVCGCFENRRLPPSAAAVARLVDDDSSIEVRRGCSPLGITTLGGAELNFAKALGDCERMGWLAVDRSGDWFQISRGDRLERFLARREEVPS